MADNPSKARDRIDSCLSSRHTLLNGSEVALFASGDGIKSKIDWLVLTLLIFVPRLLNLDTFLTADEPVILAQARDFAAGMRSGDFSLTLGNGSPAITVAGWAAAAVGLARTEMEAYLIARVMSVILTGLLLLAMFGVARSLVGRWPALIGVGLLALDPYTLAYGRLIHNAAPLALCMTLAGLAFLLWLRDARWVWMLLAGLFTGLALLTKSTALLLGPMLASMLLVWGSLTDEWREGRWWVHQLRAALVIMGLSGAIFYALWPAMWTAPIQTVNHTLQRLLVDQEAGANNLGLFWFGRFAEDPGPAFYPIAFLLKSTPWLLIGLGLSITGLRFAKDRVRPISLSGAALQSLVPLSLWLFALSYLVIMTIASKKSVRYMMPAFPSFYLLAGMAFYRLFQMLQEWSSLKYLFCSRQRLVLFLVSTLLGLIVFTGLYHPYYFSYYNPLLLGWRWAPQTMLVGWGEGLDRAARYLNNQPPGRVAAWYDNLFSILYSGDVQSVVPQENLITADHTVLYINQVQRDIPGPNIIHYFRTRRQPEHTVRLAGIDYAWVYAGPIAGFMADPAPEYPLGGEFGGETRLLGYDLDSQPIVGGESLIVTLFWRVLVQPASERFVYLRLVDEQGRIWASADSPPVMGLWPVNRWQPEMLVEDAHELDIPAGTPPGRYRLEVGLYDSTAAGSGPLAATGQPVGQGGGLLLGEVQIGWQALRAEPVLPHLTNSRLAPDARLVGYSEPAAMASTGDIFPIQLGWRGDSGLLSRLLNVPNDLVMFEWRQHEQNLAEQADWLPLPISRWGQGALLLSQHDLIVPPTLASGRYELVVMLHTGSDPAGAPFPLGTVDVTSPPHKFDLPAKARLPVGQAQLTTTQGQTISLNGYSFAVSDAGARVELYWQAETAVTTPYRVFAQLLNADNTLVAQSDGLPSAGQRPTTGWLPGEIITDSHLLLLPADLPAGTYRLISGLYDPVNGRRVPLLNAAGERLADNIVVTEVTLP